MPSAPEASTASTVIPAQQAPLPGADPGWLDSVSAWLLAHRSYPEMARALGRQGTVVVQITVDAEGHVVDLIMVHGSGTEALDNAAEALMRNAALPPFPPTMKVSRQSLTIPIRYSLR